MYNDDDYGDGEGTTCECSSLAKLLTAALQIPPPRDEAESLAVATLQHGRSKLQQLRALKTK